MNGTLEGPLLWQAAEVESSSLQILSFSVAIYYLPTCCGTFSVRVDRLIDRNAEHYSLSSLGLRIWSSSLSLGNILAEIFSWCKY